MDVLGRLSKQLSRLSRKSTVPLPEEEEDAPPSGGFVLVQHVDYDSRSLRTPEAHWESEQFEGPIGCHGCLSQTLDSAVWEVCVTACVLADLTLTILTFVLDEEVAEGDMVFYSSAGFLSVLVLDVVLRILKDRIRFFIFPFKVLNWIEFTVGILGAAMVVMDGVRRSCSGAECESAKQNKGASLGRSIRPILRFSRVLRAAFQLFLARGGLHKKIDRATDRLTDALVRQAIGGMLILPDDNVTLKPSSGMFHLEKAQVRSSAFRDLHFPFSILGGIIDLVHIDIDMFAGTSRKKRDMMSHTGHRLLVVVENVLLVVGPEHHVEEGWGFEAVKDGKSKLVELMTKVFKSSTPQAGGDDDGDGANKPKKMNVAAAKKKSIEYMKRNLKQVIGEVLAHGMHVSIKNVEIRYEDANGYLSGGPAVIGGFKVTSAQIRALGALEDEEDDDHPEEDFRVKGKWLAGDANDPKFFSEVSRKSSGGSSRSPEGPGAASSPTYFSGFGFDKEATKKRHLNHGVRVAMEMFNLCAFWDMHEGRSLNKNALYTPMLQEGTGVDILSFLHDRQRRENRERLRLAVLHRVEKSFIKRDGKSAIERMRRLRDRVAAHRYLLLPSGCSLHALVKPPAAGDRDPFEDFWPVATNIDCFVPSVPLVVDLSQAQCIYKVVNYFKTWKKQDQRVMWQPVPHHDSSQIAYQRWGLALRQVLHGIDDTYPWHSLAWVEMRRRAAINQEYLSELCTTPRDTDKIAALQVGLPLAEVLLARQAAASANAAERLKKRESRVQKLRSKLGMILLRRMSKAADSKESDEEVSLRVEQANDVMKREETSAKELEALEGKANNALPASAKAAQVLVRMDVMEAKLLCESPVVSRKPRRLLMHLKARGISCIGTRCAPRKVWMRWAPQERVQELANDVRAPEDPVGEVTVNDLRAVLCSAPTTAPRMRRLLNFTHEMDTSKREPRASQQLPAATELSRDATEILFRADSGASVQSLGQNMVQGNNALRDAGSAYGDSKKVVQIKPVASEIPMGRGASVDSTGGTLLTVVIKSAHGLRNADMKTLSDPYCIGMIEGKPETAWKTRTVHNNLAPMWNHAHPLTVPQSNEVLSFVVMDHDDKKKDDFLGQCQLERHMYYPDGFKGNLTLKGKDGSSCGKIEVKIFIDEMMEREDHAADMGPCMQIRATIIKSGEVDDKANGYQRVKEPDRCIVSAWTTGLEVYICKPFLKQLVTCIKYPALKDPTMGRRRSHLPKPKMSKDELDAIEFWENLKKIQQRHTARVVLREKKTRKNEKILGLTGPMKDKQIQCKMLLCGPMRATRLQAYSQAAWLAETATLPSGIMQGRRHPQNGVKMGFQPLVTAESNGNGPVQSTTTGWWYATESEAQLASQILSSGYLPDELQQNGDISCAGVDAYEEKEPLFTLPRAALSTWATSNDSYRYKPYTSARGLIQLPPLVARPFGVQVCPALVVECCGCSSSPCIKPIAAQISSDCGEACKNFKTPDTDVGPSKTPEAVQAGFVEVQAKSQSVATSQADPEQAPAFSGGFEPSASLSSTAYRTSEQTLQGRDRKSVV